MKNKKRSEYVARDRILKLLTDQEIARISVAEEAPRVTDGEEFVDLEQIAKGVQRGRETPTPIGRILARGAVHEDTWLKVLDALEANGLPHDAASGEEEPSNAGRGEAWDGASLAP